MGDSAQQPIFSPIRDLLPFGGTPSPTVTNTTPLLTTSIAMMQISAPARSPSEAEVGDKRLREGKPPSHTWSRYPEHG